MPILFCLAIFICPDIWGKGNLLHSIFDFVATTRPQSENTVSVNICLDKFPAVHIYSADYYWHVDVKAFR